MLRLEDCITDAIVGGTLWIGLHANDMDRNVHDNGGLLVLHGRHNL